MKRYMFFPFFDRPKRNISRQQTKKISQPQPILGIFKNAGILNFLVEFAILKIYFIMIPGTALFRRFTIRKTQASIYRPAKMVIYAVKYDISEKTWLSEDQKIIISYKISTCTSKSAYICVSQMFWK